MSKEIFNEDKLNDFKESYWKMYEAHQVDQLEQSYTGRGEAFFHVSGWGHESLAFLNHFLIKEDYLYPHYRDKSLLLARGVSPKTLFLNLFAKGGTEGNGRQMNSHISSFEHNIPPMPTPVGNSAPMAAGIAEEIKERESNPIVYCAQGEGSTAQGEFLEALNYSAIDSLPVLWVIEDNHFAISTSTEGRTFYHQKNKRSEEFSGIPITYLKSAELSELYDGLKSLVQSIREERTPQIVVIETERLDDHTNADDHRTYREQGEIDRLRQENNPVTLLRDLLLENGVDSTEISKREEEILASLKEVIEEARRGAEPEPDLCTKSPLPPSLLDLKKEYTGDLEKRELTMLEAIRATLDHQLERDSRVTLFGQDLEDPKGDVFLVTKGLSSKHGKQRVKNSILAESLIVGRSIGRSLAGGKAVGFLQFSDFLPLAYNQIANEMASTYWRTSGAWRVPVILMVSMGGYKPGLGPFHASSFASAMAQIPGLDVYLPSTAGDAAGMLNTAFESGRPSLFFYPKSSLNDRDRGTSSDIAKHLVPPGVARVVRRGEDISFVSYGNPLKLCEKVADILEKEGVNSDVIDLRTLSPWDKNAVLESAKKTKRILLVDEDNQSCGIASELAATVAEEGGSSIELRRVARKDTFIPFNFENQMEVLPSKKRILETAVSLLGGTVEWKKSEARQDGLIEVRAQGSSPSDESISIQEWKVEVGERVTAGQIIAEAEADKASMTIVSPVDGIIKEILLEPYEMYKVGSISMLVESESNAVVEVSRSMAEEDYGTPIIQGIAKDLSSVNKEDEEKKSEGASLPKEVVVQEVLNPALVAVKSAHGSFVVTNEMIVEKSNAWESSEQIVKGSGIESRRQIGEGESSLTLGRDALLNLLASQDITLEDVDLLICATGTPGDVTPSLATRIQYEVNEALQTEALCAAYDVGAACGGYLYALSQAWYYLSQPRHQNKRVVLVTSEVLSPLVDIHDKNTSSLFSDAATATLLVGAALAEEGEFRLNEPVLGAQGESGENLFVPSGGEGKHIRMHGVPIFLNAQKYMIEYLKRAISEANLTLEQLDLIIPHQANLRIIKAMAQRLRFPLEKVYTNISNHGNSSSSTIPLCLEEIFSKTKEKVRIMGLTAFGGGYTFGGGILSR